MNRLFLLTFWFFSLIWSIFSSIFLLTKPNLNLPYLFENGSLIFYKDFKEFNFKKGDIIISIDGEKIEKENEYINIVKKKKIGEKISFEFERNGIKVKNDFVLKPFKEKYSSFIIAASILIFLFLSLIVYLSKPEDKKVKILFFFSILFVYDSVGGYFPYLKFSYPHSPLYPFYILMIFLVPPSIFYFFSVFPREIKIKKFLINSFFLLSFILGILFIFLILKTNIFYKDKIYIIPFYYFFFWLVIFPVFICLYYIFKSKEEKETIQAKWVLFSFVLAGILHITIRLIPFITQNKIFIDKSYIILIDLLFPLSIIISIKKHNLFDINRLFYKTILYFFSFFFFLLLYIFIANNISTFFETSMQLSQILSIFLSLLILYPFFKILNKILNKIFLRTEIETIEKIENLGKDIMELYNLEEIKRKVREDLKDILKVDFLEFDLNKFQKEEGKNLFYKMKGQKWEGFLSIGEKLSEQKFTKSEKKSLKNLILQIQKSIDFCFLRKELLEKEKLAALGRISSIIAHEIKNPLNGMKLILYYLSQKYGEIEEVKILLNEIERLQKILNDVQDWSKEIKLSKKNFEIYNFLSHLENLISPILKEKEIDFIIEKPKENFVINADFERLEQVFLNLTQNSIKAIGNKKGKIIFKTYLEDFKCFFHFEDNGAGIEDEEKEKIFEPFFSSTGSTGLGLFVVKKIIDSHNGNITVFSEKNKGARFLVCIPY